MLNFKYLPKEIEPRQFCRIWFGLDKLSAKELDQCETETGYRANCVKVLSRVLKVSPRAVRNWGEGLEFERIPQHYKQSLGYALDAAKNRSRIATAA